MNSLGLCLVLVLTMVEVRVAGDIPTCVDGKTTPGNVPFCLPQDYDKVMSGVSRTRFSMHTYPGCNISAMP